VAEETGLAITVGAPCLVNEFADPASGFHQVELFFRCSLASGDPIPADWRDVEGVVSRWRWVDAAEIATLRVKPDSLARIAWSDAIAYDALEHLVR
jgi:8-oxo-dGTP pyrophosphatase MutT (NUDIX family)